MNRIKCFDCGHKNKMLKKYEELTCERCGSHLATQRRNLDISREEIELSLYKIVILSKILLGIYLALFTTMISLNENFLNTEFAFFYAIELAILFCLIIRLGLYLYRSKVHYNRVKKIRLSDNNPITSSNHLESLEIDQAYYTGEILTLKLFYSSSFSIVYSIFLLFLIVFLFDVNLIFTNFIISFFIFILWKIFWFNIIKKRRDELMWDKRYIRTFYESQKVIRYKIIR